MTDQAYATPLPRKLGIKEQSRVALVNPPVEFAELVEQMPPGSELLTARYTDLDVLVFFTRTRAELEERFPRLARHVAPTGGLWVGYPKKSSPIDTDIDFNIVQAVGLSTGMVDNKVAALDEDWTGLRFVVRVENRDTWPPP